MSSHEPLADDVMGRRIGLGPDGDGHRVALAVAGIAFAALLVAALTALVIQSAG